MVLCEVRLQKYYPNQIRITVADSRISYPGDKDTPTGSLNFVNLMIDSVLSRLNACCVWFDFKKQILQTPMDQPEYVRIKLSDISQKFIEEYNFTQLVQNGWIYFDILRGWYGLPQPGRISNDLLCKHLEKSGYFEAATTPGLWRHKWRLIQDVLIVDDFGIKYVRNLHALHLLKILEDNHKITGDWEGKRFVGIHLAWNHGDHHAKRTCHIYINGNIEKLLIKYGHLRPSKEQL